MSKRHLIRTAIVCVSLFGLTGCGIGFNPGTNQRASGNGANQNVGDLEIRNATIVVDPRDPSAGTLLVSIYNKGNQTDRLAGITSLEFESQIGAVLPIETNQALSVGLSADEKIYLASTTLALIPGTYVKTTFTFANAPAATLPILVNTNTGNYKDIELP